jgi:hypothetical protein
MIAKLGVLVPLYQNLYSPISKVFAEKDKIGFTIDWYDQNFGFGKISIFQFNKNGKIVLKSETMGKNFCKKILNALIDQSEIN